MIHKLGDVENLMVIGKSESLFAAHVIDAEIQVTPEHGRRYETCYCNGKSLCMYRRIIDCDDLRENNNTELIGVGAVLENIAPCGLGVQYRQRRRKHRTDGIAIYANGC